MTIKLRELFEASALPKPKKGIETFSTKLMNNRRNTMAKDLVNVRDPKNGAEGKEVAKLIRKHTLSSEKHIDRNQKKVKDNFTNAREDAVKTSLGI